MNIYLYSKLYIRLSIYQKEITTFAFGREFRGLLFDILDSYVRFLIFVWLYFGKMWKFLEKRPFFRADMAGLGKYHMGGYGRIGVYRVKFDNFLINT